MKYNSNDFDGIAHLAFDRTTGCWAYQLYVKGRKSDRSAGRLPAEASPHTLLCCALITCLRSITKSHAARLSSDANVKKPRLLVVTGNSDFNEALAARMRLSPTPKKLRAGRNFISLLAQQVARFDIKFATPEDGDPSVFILGNWMTTALINPKLLTGLPESLHPSVVGGLL